MLLTFILLAALADAQAPQAQIANRQIRATVYLPDAKDGYYQGTRFDWSGSIASLEWNQHSYFGKWFGRYDPKIHDAITGPVEEFSSLGYDEAKAGETFVRIGVGTVRKPQEASYQRFKTYEIVDGGRWRVNKGKNWIEFVHELPGVYRYTKKLRLVNDALVIEHRLQNAGAKEIKTSVYNHDFFMLDAQPTGPDVAVKFPFTLKSAADFAGLAEVRGQELDYLKELQPGQTVYTEFTGFGASPADFDYRVENKKTGAGVRETGDRAISKLVFWSIRSTVCPEAYIDLKIAPGKSEAWKITYRFYQAQ